MKISQEAFDLIVAEEVSSKATYIKKYQTPEWPGASSGVTIAIGYDLGQANKAKIEADWKGLVSDEMLEVMKSCAGVTGVSAKSLTAKVKKQITIPWEKAIEVFENKDIPQWENTVIKALPNTELLSPDQFGALVSLAYNRGASFNNVGGRYQEMRQIKEAMKAKEFNKIPGYFRAMKRLWPNLVGLRNRREHEAKLFEKGL